MSFIGREHQLGVLSNAIDNAINFSLIIVHGPPSSGKSLILNHVLKEKAINHVYISCRGLSTVKLRYEFPTLHSVPPFMYRFILSSTQTLFRCDAQWHPRPIPVQSQHQTQAIVEESKQREYVVVFDQSTSSLPTRRVFGMEKFLGLQIL